MTDDGHTKIQYISMWQHARILQEINEVLVKINVGALDEAVMMMTMMEWWGCWIGSTLDFTPRMAWRSHVWIKLAERSWYRNVAATMTRYVKLLYHWAVMASCRCQRAEVKASACRWWEQRYTFFHKWRQGQWNGYPISIVNPRLKMSRQATRRAKTAWKKEWQSKFWKICLFLLWVRVYVHVLSIMTKTKLTCMHVFTDDVLTDFFCGMHSTGPLL